MNVFAPLSWRRRRHLAAPWFSRSATLAESRRTRHRHSPRSPNRRSRRRHNSSRRHDASGPGINYVRVDVIVTDKDGKPVLDMKQDDFSLAEDGKPQKIDSFSVVKLDATRDRRERPPRVIRYDFDEEREVGASRRAALRHSARRLPRQARQRHGRAQAAHRLHPEPARAGRHGGDHVSADAGDDLHFSRDRDAAISAIENFEGRKFDYRPRNSVRGEVRRVSRRRRSSASAMQITMDALKAAAVQDGRPARRTQVDHLRQRGLHEHVCRRSCPIRSRRCQASATRTAANSQRARRRPDSSSSWRDADLYSRHAADVRRRSIGRTRPIYARRSARPRGVRVRHQRGRRACSRTPTACARALDSLHMIAANTDGRAIVNRNDLAAGMKQIIRDSSGYYLLGLQLVAGADRRQVPRHQGQRQAQGRGRPRAQGLLGLHRWTTWPAGDGARGAGGRRPP